jgi:PAS domain S-box-containing protein
MVSPNFAEVQSARPSQPNYLCVLSPFSSFNFGVRVKASRTIEDIYELTYIRKDGSRFPAMVSVTALRDVEGAIIGYLLIGTDNTARRRAEQDRKRIFALSQDMLCVLGFDGYFKELNPAWVKTLGYSKVELRAMPFIDLIHPADRERTLTEAANVADGESLVGFVNRYRRKDGSYRWFEWTVTPVIEDGVMYGVARDVTDRKLVEEERMRAEEARRASEARYRVLFECAPDGIVICDPNGVYLDANGSICEMLGYPLDELIGQPSSKFIADVDIEHIGPALREIQAKPPYHREWKFRRKDDSIFDADVIATTMPDGNVLAMIRDVTERKRFREALQASLSDRELLLREIHHRVKNNMQMVCSLLQLQARHAQNPVMTAILHESQNRVRSMALIHEKLYGGDSLARIDLAEYLRSLGAMIQRSHSDRAGVQLRFDTVSLTAGMDTAVPLGLAVNELLTNAFKHAFPAAARAAMAAPEIVIALQPEADGWLRLEVRDNGVGLPANFAPETNGSLGMRLVQIFAKQLHCELIWGSGSGGSVFQMCFRELPPKRPQPLEPQLELSI